jgi:hypothetical protein
MTAAKPEVIPWAKAKALGIQRYYPGRPCKNGHIAEHYTSNGGCVRCAADRYRADQRKFIARARAWNEENLP